jgi:hypothetical protein
MGSSYANKIRQKRGEGRGKEYTPWYKVNEVSGSGKSTRVLGFKTGRTHHFLSDFEAGLFYIFDLNDNIEDIREQFPLKDIDLAKELAEEAGIKYPSNRNDEVHVLTSDYCITYTDGREIMLTIKHLNDIDKRQLERFEIERRYWKHNGVQWNIITEKEMPGKDELLNYKDIHSALRRFKRDNPSEKQFQEMVSSILKYYEKSSEMPLTQFTSTIDSELNIKKGYALMLIKAFIAKGMIKTDLTEPLVTSKRKMKDLNFTMVDAKNIRKSDLAA